MKLHITAFLVLILTLFSTTAFADSVGEYSVEYGAHSIFSSTEEAALFSETDAAYQALADGLKNRLPDINLRAYNLSATELSALFERVTHDDIHLFYVGTRYSYSYSGNLVTKITPNYIGLETLDADMAELDRELDSLLALVKPEMSDLDKMIVLHDALAYRYQYDLNYENYAPGLLLIRKTGVCQAYALGYRYLLKQFGITSDYVTSDPMNHGWNMVLLDEQWYHVDVTWDDPITDLPGRVEHRYFLRSDAAMLNDESPHYSWVAAHNATDTRYDTAAYWSNVSSAMFYHNGTWYYTKGNAVTARNARTGESEVLATISDRWPVADDPDYYWSGCFARLSLFEGALYWNTPTEIKVFNLATREQRTLLSPNVGGNSIYSMVVLGDRLTYGLGLSPNDAISETHTITLTPEPQPTAFTLTVQNWDNTSLTVQPDISNAPQGAYVWIAAFDENGVVHHIARSTGAAATLPGNFTTVRAFLWQMPSMVPLCEPQTLQR